MVNNVMSELRLMKYQLKQLSTQIDSLIEDFKDLNEIYEQKIFREGEFSSGIISDFIEEIKTEFHGLRYIPDVFLYEKYKMWHVNKVDHQPYSERQFKFLVEREMKRIGYFAPYENTNTELNREVAYRKTRNFDVSTHTLAENNDYFAYLQAISNFTLEDTYENETYYELESNYITNKDVNHVYHAIAFDQPIDLNKKNNINYIKRPNLKTGLLFFHSFIKRYNN